MGYSTEGLSRKALKLPLKAAVDMKAKYIHEALRALNNSTFEINTDCTVSNFQPCSPGVFRSRITRCIFSK